MPSRAMLVVVLCVALTGMAAAAPKVAPRPADDATQSFLRQMGEAQKWLGEEVWTMKQQVEALPGLVAEAKEGHATTQEEIEKLRDEVKGLYVEISSVKQQIVAMKGNIDGVNANVSGFRTFSGFFLALMIIMVAIIFVMTIRR
jgi:peptidoglycan hydrolase CwlO-like protein